MPSNNELTRRIRAPFSNLMGASFRRWGFGAKNDFMYKAQNAAGTNELDLVGTDALDNLLVGGQVFRPHTTAIKLDIAANAKIATVNPFFVNANDRTPLEIMGVSCVYATADGAANTGYVSKDGVGQAAGAGSSCMTSTFNLNTTTNTVQNATLANSGVRGTPSLVLGPGEQLSFNLGSAVTSLAGLQVTVYVRPLTGAAVPTYWRAANGDIATYTMYLNLIPGMVVRQVAMRWGTAGTNGSAVTADVTKDTSTNAPGAGTSILLAAQSVKGTANVTVFPALAASAATLTMASGDRLAVKMTGTLTALANLVVTVFFNASADSHVVIPLSSWDGVATDRTLFLARNYFQVVDFWETWSTASTSNNQLLTKDTGTTAPGAGTGLITDNTNAGILTSATANTPVGSLTLSAVSTKPTLWLAPGDRLGLKNANTTGSLAGLFAAVVLRKV